MDFAILGADFLKHFGLVVDLQAGRLLDTVTLQCFPVAVAPASPPALSGGLFAAVAAMPQEFRSIFSEFQDVANQSGVMPPAVHDVVHHIVTDGPPATARFRRLDPAKLMAAKRDFAKLEAEGIVRRSSSSWSSPLHMVLKEDGSWKPCGDYRRLNLVTKPDTYPLPNIQDLSALLHGCKIFSKLDLRKGYYQVPVREEDIHKTAVITPFGLWEFRRMPFGPRNAGQSFQRFMDQVFNGLDCAFVYLDEILVGSASPEEHLRHLWEVLQRLHKFGLVLDLDKCQLGRASVDFLGHLITAESAAPVQKHVAAIQEFPRLSDAKQLQSFLGLVNFYRRFIPAAAQILLPLTEALKGSKPAKLCWTPAMVHTFSSIKAALCQATVLSHPDPEAEICLAVDASNTHIGAVLQQREGQAWRPLAFFSKKLDSTQLKCSAFDRELLAASLRVRHFRYLLDGRNFHILMDHKPLTQALHRVSDPWTARQQRQLSFLAELTADVRHVASKANVVADALSRPPLNTQPGTGLSKAETCGRQPPIIRLGPQSPASAVEEAGFVASMPVQLPGLDYRFLAAKQKQCEVTQKLLSSSSLQLQEFPIQGGSLLCDVSLGSARPVVPQSLRQAVFDTVHGLAHPGIRASKRLISRRFVWNRMGADIGTFC